MLLRQRWLNTNIKTDLLVEEFSPQSVWGPLAGEQQGWGGAEVMVGRMVQDHTAGPLGTSDTTAPTLQLRRHLTGRAHLVKTLSSDATQSANRHICKFTVSLYRHVLPELWAPEVALLIGLSLGLSMLAPGWGLLGTEELAFAKHRQESILQFPYTEDISSWNHATVTFTFHIVLQNDNPLVTVSFDPDHLIMTWPKTNKKK